MESLTIAVAQPETVAHAVAGNAERHGALVRRAGARLVVFPELSLTGYHFGAAAIDPADPRLEPLVDAAVDTGSVVLAGAVVATASGRRSIGVLRFDHGRPTVVYRKQCLGAAETSHFVAGDRPAAVEVDGWRIGLAVCRDTGIAAHAEATVALGVDLYAAGVLEHRTDGGVTAARAEAIAVRHSIWVAMASYAGAADEGYHQAAGGSGVWAPDGSCRVVAGEGPGEVVGTDCVKRALGDRTDGPASG